MDPISQIFDSPQLNPHLDGRSALIEDTLLIGSDYNGSPTQGKSFFFFQQKLPPQNSHFRSIQKYNKQVTYF